MTKPRGQTQKDIIDVAIKTFLRFGTRKTSMNDIASEAGVSRQTLYDLFGNKDGLICACIRAVSDDSLANIQKQTKAMNALSDKLDVYFDENVVKGFEMLQSSVDIQDLVSHHNKAGQAEILETKHKNEALLSFWLEPHADALKEMGHGVQSLAHFFVTISLTLKYEASDRADLDTLMKSLKRLILSASGV